jgi:DNA-binding XRE family transcriptional regulator
VDKAVESLLTQLPDEGPVPPLPPVPERARLREEWGWTKSQLGEALGVARETVWTWEKEPPRSPRGKTGQLYARLLAHFAAQLAGRAALTTASPVVSGAVPVDGDAAPQDEDAGDAALVPAAALPMEVAETEFDAPGSWDELPEGVVGPCVRCGGSTPYLVDGLPRHLYLEAAARTGVPRCGTRPVLQAAPASEAPAAALPAPSQPDDREAVPPEPAGASEPPEPDSAPGPAVPQQQAPVAASPRAGAPSRRPADAPAPASRRKPAKKPAVKTVAPEHADGPIAVLDLQDAALTAYLVDGRAVPCPARTIQALATWALDKNRIRLGAGKLHDNGFDQDPLLILTASAVAYFDLPAHLEDQEGLRLPADHKIVKQLTRGGWELTKSGFGPWPRIFKRLDGRRYCVQLAVVPWRALETRAWGDTDHLSAEQLARLLGSYADLVITPRGTVAVSGEELMTALRPPTKAVWNAQENRYVSGKVPGTLHTVVEPAPCEAPDEHPLVAADYPDEGTRPAGEALDEEACIWVRPVDLVTGEERARSHVVALDVTMAFLAACRRLHVGTGPAVHRPRNPDFDPDLPGSWYLDLSHVEIDPRMPNPFTSSGLRPEGPAWYATPTVEYAVELDAHVRPLEAWVREVHSPYLQPWYERLRAAYLTTMAGLGVTADLGNEEFLAAMAAHKDGDPALVTLLNAIKSTAKSGIGKLRQRPNLGLDYIFGEPWPALSRKTWRPDIRAMILSKARTNMHRKMWHLATTANLWPLAVNTDCVVYPSDGLSPIPVLLGPDGQPVRGGFRIGINPGSVKHQGSQTMEWAVDLLTDGVNIANEIKDASLVRAA